MICSLIGFLVTVGMLNGMCSHIRQQKIITLKEHKNICLLLVYVYLCLSLLTFIIHQVWFQNQRAKMKKIQKKARQENKNNKEDECSEDKSQKTKVKEEEQSKNSF